MSSAGLVDVSFFPAAVTVRVRPGTTLLQAGTAAGLSLAYGCTQGQCGTDPVRILQGGAGLEPVGETEAGTLERMGLAGDFRLSCCARALQGPIQVQVDAF